MFKPMNKEKTMIEYILYSLQQNRIVEVVRIYLYKRLFQTLVASIDQNVARFN